MLPPVPAALASWPGAPAPTQQVATGTALYTTLPRPPTLVPGRAESLVGRIAAIHAGLEERLPAGARWAKGRLADRALLERVHTKAYLDRLWWLRTEAGSIYEHRAVLPGSLEQILWSAGTVVSAVEEVLDGRSRRAAAFVEPPGHHAERDSGAGFCAVNNVAIAVAHALATRPVERVLVVDWDVHHGNGTQQAFEARRDVCFVDFHQHPLFPGSGGAEELGIGEGRGCTVNVPLPAGQGDADYALAFESILAPLADRYRPQLVVVSAGFDAHADDPLGGMKLSAAGFARLTAIACRIAELHAQGRVVLALEGGYHPPALAECAAACVEVLSGKAPPPIEERAGDAVRRVVDEVRAVHRAVGSWA